MTRAECLELAGRLYASAPRLRRTVQGLRPEICPFDVLVDAVPAGASVLDVGCGSGLFLGLLAASGRLGQGQGFDSDASAIAAAEAMRGGLPADQAARLEFRHQAVAAPWPDGRFDVVALIDVLHHVPLGERAGTITRAADRVAPGGLLLCKDIAPRPLWRAWANRLHDLVMARQWVSYTALDQVVAWAGDAGLVAVRRERMNRWWYGHDLAVLRRA